MFMKFYVIRLNSSFSLVIYIYIFFLFIYMDFGITYYALPEYSHVR